MIVADTNVIAYLFINGDHTSQAKKLLKIDQEWMAPVLWKSEFRNILALYIRKGLLSFENSILLLNEVENFMNDHEYDVSSTDVSSTDVMSLISKSNCSAYDCEYVALAESLNTKLYTSDKKLIREFPDTVVSLNSI